MATEMCPAECREVRSYIDYPRENLLIPDGTTTVDPETGAVTQNGTYILAEDNESLLQTIMAKGYCTIHTTTLDPENPDGEDPNNPDGGDPDNPEGTDPTVPGEPGDGEETDHPTEPSEPGENTNLSEWLNSLLP